MAKQVATVGSMHTCPMCSGTVPHVGGPVIGPGVPNVLINGKPVAVMGDKCMCNGAPDVIIQGNPTVLINGMPIACVGDMTAHGGMIISGEPNVIIGSNSPENTVTMPLKQIPFPKLTVRDNIGATIKGKGKSHRQAKENINRIKNELMKDTLQLSNLQWQMDGQNIDKAIVGDMVQLTADVTGISEGSCVYLQIFESNNNTENQFITGVAGYMKENKISIDWEVSHKNKTNNTKNDKQYLYPRFVFKGTTSNTCDTQSNELKVFGWIKVKLIMDGTGNILANTQYTLHHPDGSQEKGTSDNEGYINIPEIEIGNFQVSVDI